MPDPLAILLALTPAASSAGFVLPGAALPLHELSTPCQDMRYPAMAGPWAVGCGPGGEVDRAVNVETGAVVRLPVQLTSPALAESQLFSTEGLGAWLTLDGAQASAEPRLVRQTPASGAPPAFDGTHTAIFGPDHITVGTPDSRLGQRFKTRPAGWYPPALAWPWVAWVARGEQGQEEVWAVDTSRAAEPRVLAGGAGDARHVVGSASWLAWVEPGQIVRLNVLTGARQVIRADAGFSAPISLWRDVVCWEDRSGEDLDVRCSDGLEARGPGDQSGPSRWGPYLLYRSGGAVWVKAADPS